MTIWYLLEALKEALEHEFQGFLLWDKGTEHVPINVYLQNLPAPEVGSATAATVFPYITVRYTSMEDGEANEPGLATVIFIVGVYDKGGAYQGYKDVINVQEKIRQMLLRKPNISDRFMLEHPLKCFTFDDFDDSSYPYFYGGLESRWRIPAILQNM